MKLIKFLILTLLVLFPFGQLTRLPLFFSPLIRVYAPDVVIFFLIVTYLINLVRNPQRFRKPPLVSAILLFAAAAGISLVANAGRYEMSELAIGSLYLVRWISYAFVYAASYSLAYGSKNDSNHIITLLTASGVIAALFGLVQYVTYPDLRNLMYLGWDPHEYRVFGTFLDSGFTGLFYVLTLILITIRFMHSSAGNKTDILSKISNLFRTPVVWGICWIMTYLALALTYSRSSFLSLLVAFGIISLFRKTVLPFFFIAILLAVTVLLLPRPSETAEGTKLERTASVGARLTNYQQSLEIIKDSPVYGIGFNMMRYENRERGFVQPYEWQESNAAAGLDNSFLFIWATTGIVGLIAFFNIIFRIFKSAMKQFGNETTLPDRVIRQLMEMAGEVKQWDVLTLSTLAAVITHSFFNNSLFYPWVMLWIWLLLGIGYGTRDRLGVSGAVAGNYFNRLLAVAQSVFMRK
ncbi:MAG TPA: O-antigen ligase family protein [Patescibacteria group bacterium]|nr:O-antigen ligase family protein [Patescibacteria group bacterium]